MPTLNMHVDVSNIYTYIDGELLKKLLPKCSVILTNTLIPLFLLTFYLHVNDTLHEGLKKLKRQFYRFVFCQFSPVLFYFI